MTSKKPTVRQRDTWLKKLSEQTKRPMDDLIVLTRTNDPFNIESSGRKKDAEWFAIQYRRFGFGVGTHVRRIHYRIVSQPLPILMPDGRPYENTMLCSAKLATACRDARYLDLVDIDDFVDRQNRESAVNLTELYGRGASLEIEAFGTIEMPSLPELVFSSPKVLQRYHLELVCEKSTVDEILLPLAQKYEVNANILKGEISLTRCNNIIARAKASGRPCRILYISDFDPAGQVSMPVACARKIEFLIWKKNLDLDIQLRPVVLTHEQCEEYELPRTPIKETERRAAGFEERFGEGATELDALEALHPGALREIIVAEIERYYDTELDEGVADVAAGIDEDIDFANATVHEQYGDEIAALERDCAELEERRRSLWERIEASLDTESPSIDDIEWPESADGDEDDDPLYDSRRSYLDQIERYKRYQGKEVKGRFLRAADQELVQLAKSLREDGLTFPEISVALAGKGHFNKNGNPYTKSTIKRWADQGRPPEQKKNNTTSEVIALTKRLRADGLSYSKIIAALTDQGHLNNNGVPYNSSSIYKMLKAAA
jgi:hypothetical protein